MFFSLLFILSFTCALFLSLPSHPCPVKEVKVNRNGSTKIFPLVLDGDLQKEFRYIFSLSKHLETATWSMAFVKFPTSAFTAGKMLT